MDLTSIDKGLGHPTMNGHTPVDVYHSLDDKRERSEDFKDCFVNSVLNVLGCFATGGLLSFCSLMLNWADHISSYHFEIVFISLSVDLLHNDVYNLCFDVYNLCCDVYNLCCDVYNLCCDVYNLCCDFIIYILTSLICDCYSSKSIVIFVRMEMWHGIGYL